MLIISCSPCNSAPQSLLHRNLRQAYTQRYQEHGNAERGHDPEQRMGVEIRQPGCCVDRHRLDVNFDAELDRAAKMAGGVKDSSWSVTGLRGDQKLVKPIGFSVSCRRRARNRRR